ncbi:MAG: type II toxin-antitoxin system death-on-curing family toxin [Deltaproteobacteria bacterium]|nr:type II toxin-antitoxin system death-on-curing family toxin [Deltaproteobacteria bacterium]
MKLPTASQLITVHDVLVERWGGEGGFYDHANGAGVVESALYTAATAVEVEGLSVFEAAALLGAYLLTSHPFLDGNKRTAASSILAVLEANKVSLTASPRRLFEKIVSLQRAT